MQPWPDYCILHICTETVAVRCFGDPLARQLVNTWSFSEGSMHGDCCAVPLCNRWPQKQPALRQGHPSGCSVQPALGAEVSSESNSGEGSLSNTACSG